MNLQTTPQLDTLAEAQTLSPALQRACAAVAWAMLRTIRRPPLPTPRALGLRYRPVRLLSHGAPLSAWYVPREGSTAGIVLSHGYNNCRGEFLSLLRPLHEAGFNLLLFDHRSQGTSPGNICTYGFHEQRDVLTAVEWLRREAEVERLGLLGYSMGGASVLLAAAQDPTIEAVVTDCAFARLEEMLERKFVSLPAHLRGPVMECVCYWAEHYSGASIAAVDPEAAVMGWRPRPLLVVHGERDALVPPEHGRRLARAGGEQAELWMVPNAPHVRCRQRGHRAYVERVTRFLRRHLQP